MSKSTGSDNSLQNVRSSYFQTEFTIPRKSDDSSSDEQVGVINKLLRNLPLDGKFEQRRNTSESSVCKKVSISVQTGRSLIGHEDTLPKERKRWIRPPVVGQASTSNDAVPGCHNKESSSEDEKQQIQFKKPESLDYVTTVGISHSRKDYINSKPMEGSYDQNLPPVSDQMDYPRVISPSSVSSVTSRPLEWDSGADVGYFQNYGTVSRSDQEFSSTMERIALVQGRSGMLTRSDPEGTSSSKKGNVAVTAIGLPTAESTHININLTEDNSSSIKNSRYKPNESKQKYHPLFPEVIIQYKGSISDTSNECVSPQKDMFEDSSKDYKLKKSNSLENVTEIKDIQGQAATFPRSQSQSNVSNEFVYNSHLQRVLNPPQSVSSSSVATVITGLPKISKSIQTSYIKNDNGIKSSTIGSSVHNTDERKAKQNGFSTQDSAALSTDDRVNSFEYLPGHVYEKTNKSHIDDFWESNKGESLKNDVERGVQIIEEFIQGSNANNTLKRKELLHRVVEKLIETDYPEDLGILKSAPQRCATRRSQNREEVIGESSSEGKQAVRNKVLNNSSSLTGQSISAIQTTSTESTKSSIQSIPPPIIKSQGSGSSKRTDKNACRDKSTDASTESKSDWKESVTRAEKLYEMKKERLKKGDHQLLEFVNSERENQIDWIVKEINHLSNLKTLLEKHERLRKNLHRLKTAKSKTDLSPNKHNLVRPTGFKRRSQYLPSSHKAMETNTNYKRRSQIVEDKGWDSHNYEADRLGWLKHTVSTETKKEDILVGPNSLAYTITFDPEIKPQKISKPEVRPMIADRQTLEKESRTRVREAFRHPSLQVGRNAS
ncbi:centrosome-associated protein Alms1a isoform X2 [Halyomorpha halys]|uniref:centrosome-associated protein Alms1a isoform X2 n=1 Tax=Halyomorpha halys TaxID=286706 RepID=UPI0006D4EC75|nr:uncharacterized protein LOC106684949 isoform X2 [Halyomorpha halys]